MCAVSLCLKVRLSSCQLTVNLRVCGRRDGCCLCVCDVWHSCHTRRSRRLGERENSQISCQCLCKSRCCSQDWCSNTRRDQKVPVDARRRACSRCKQITSFDHHQHLSYACFCNHCYARSVLWFPDRPKEAALCQNLLRKRTDSNLSRSLLFIDTISTNSWIISHMQM